MDKWDDFTGRIKNSILAEEPEAAVAAAFDYLAEFGRQIERIANSLEPVQISGMDGLSVEPQAEEPAGQVHDL